MRKSKRIIAIIACLTMVAMLFSIAGCGKTPEKAEASKTSEVSSVNTAEKSDAKPEELYTIKFLQNQKTMSRSDETPIGKIIKDKFNIVFEFEQYTGSWDEKQAVMLAAGDYSELLWITSNDMVAKYAKAGAALKLDDLFSQYGKNITEKYKDIIPYWRLAAEDGGIYKYEYLVPNETAAYGPQLDIIVRADALEAMGYPELLSEDSWIEFLKGAKEKLPKVDGKDILGMVDPLAEDWGMGMTTYGVAKGKYTTVAGAKSVLWDNESKQYIDYMTNPYVKDSVKFFNKLYVNGLLDKEAFTDKMAQVTDKLNTGRPLASFFSTWIKGPVNSSLEAAGKGNMKYVLMPFMLNSQLQNKDKRVLVKYDVSPRNSMVITKNAKYPERIVKLLDWVASDEGQFTLGWGVEGTHYTVENGRRVPSAEFLNGMKNDPDYAIKQGLWGTYDFLGASYGTDANKQFYCVFNDPSYSKLSLSDVENKVLQKYGWESEADPWIKNKSFGFDTMASGNLAISLPTGTNEVKVEQKIIELRDKTIPRLIMSKNDAEFEKEWEKFVAAYNALNPQPVIQKYNEIYKSNAEKLETLKAK